MKTQIVLFSKICLLLIIFLAAINLKAEIMGDTLSPAALSFLQAPPDALLKPLPAQAKPLLISNVGYGHNAQVGELYDIDPQVPEIMSAIAPFPIITSSGDFAPGDPFNMYMMNMTDNALMSVDINDGTILNTVLLPLPFEGGNWTVLTINKETGDFYGIATNGEMSNLYTINVIDGAVEIALVMPMDIPAIVSGSFDEGGMLYLFDIALDNIWRLNTDLPGDMPQLLGPAGFDGNYAQGMGYCPWMDEVILAAYNNTAGPQMRLLDCTTGLITLVAELPGETTAFAFPYEVEQEDDFLMAGQDLYTIPMATMLLGEDLPFIPDGFFGPGSEPFFGNISLKGQNSDGGQFPREDLNINRTGDLPLSASLPSTGEVPIEIVQLSLSSTTPIIVQTGADPSFWDVELHLVPSWPQQGNLMANKQNLNGGDFFMDFVLMPELIFTEVENPDNKRVFNPSEFGFTGLHLFSGNPMPWMAPPIANEFDPFWDGGRSLVSPSGSEIVLVPLLKRQDNAFLSMDLEGQPESWEGTGINNSEWYYYPYTDWWNVWFYDHPLDVNRQKFVSGVFTIMPRDISQPSYVEVILGWSTPEWPAWNGFPEDASPPLPGMLGDLAMEEMMIERTEAMFTMEGIIDQEISFDIPANEINTLTGLFNYNPEWIFIDVRGYNFVIYGELDHICFKPWPTCEVICPPDMTVCATDDAFTLSGASPAGGSYSGSGVDASGNFDPGAAYWGDNTITYTYVCPDGTLVTCTFTIHVIPPPEMVCPPNMSVCYSDWLITLPEGFPAGGSFSGSGIVGNLFKTFVAGVGTHTITYSVTDPCPGSCTFTITVHPNPEISCPDDFTMCANDPVLDLQTLVSPAGGSFMGGNTFNPSTAPPGVPLQFNYTYTDPQTNCSSSCTFYITVYPNPVVSCPGDMDMCSNDPPVNLQTLVSPSGGSFMGSDTFDPGTAPPGVPLQFNYTYTDPATGCKGYCTFYITTYTSPVVTCPPSSSSCIDDAPFALAGASPAGGSYGGAGVAGGMFNPAAAGAGNHTLTYSYTDSHGCSGSCTFTITVNNKPQVNCPPNMERCANDPAFALAGATPAGGGFTGAGVAGGSFSPAAAGAGNHTITYTYTDPDTGCTGTCTFTITVHALPNVICPGDISKCIDDPVFALAGAIPAGGNYAGPGVAGGNFDPFVAGLGAHNITYTYTDPDTGCINSCTFKITVHPLPIVTCPLNMTFCDNDPAFVLAGAAPLGGTYSNLAGNPIVNFNPMTAGVGVHFIFYDYTDPITGCSNWCMFKITVNPSPNVVCPANMNKCIDDPAFALAGATPMGGVYAGPGVVAGNFSPLAAGVGNHNITYTYTDPVNGCSNSCSFTIKVNPLPNVVCPPNMTVCDNDPAFVLAGAAPAGGVYSDLVGIPIVNFNPAAWGVGVHTIFYDYTDPVTGCSNWCSFTITVIASPIVTCPPNMAVCIDAMPIPLVGGMPAGGWYWKNGPGIAGANFNPAIAGVGAHVVNYSYTDPATGCIGTCSFAITVNPLPNVVCPANMFVCDNAPAFALAGAVPAGGTYLIGAVPVAIFNPVLAPLGVTVLTYSYTDPVTGCVGTCAFTITVVASPVVSCPPNMNVCIDAPTFALAGGMPAGGTYAMGAVNIVNFNPAAAGVGLHTISYSYTDPVTLCTGSCTFTINVNPLPNVVCPPDTVLSIFDTPFMLSGARPAGGIYLNAAGDTIVGFNPMLAGLGSHIISYEYTDQNGCSNSCSFTITVIEGNIALDFGDAPDSISGFDYHTRLLNNGARHIIDPDVFLGMLIDAEADGQSDMLALGDDNNNLDDEDGVRIRRFMAVGGLAKISVKASVDGFLNAWVDFNLDGDWSGVGEQIFTDQPITVGWNTLAFMVPANAEKGRTYARFRFNTTGGLSFEGLAENGEVEDYRVSIFPEDWAYELTDLSHIIVIPQDMGQVLLAGEIFMLEPDDIIGAFYNIRAGEACGGAILWNGTENQTLMAFGNDPLSGEKDGFDEGENFGFKVYRPATGEEFDVEATFDPEMPNSDGKFHNNGMSAFAGINLAGLSQTLVLSVGWSGLSTWLEPLDTDIENMFNPVVDDIVILYNGDGMYWPGENTNSLEQWDAHKGYVIKMANNAMLSVDGEELTDVSFDLSVGWNIVPVLSEEPFDIGMLFDPLAGFVAAKEVAGMGLYLPGYGINTIGNMLPGHAYFANSTQAGTISFIAGPAKSTIEYSAAIEPASPWNVISHTPESHIVVFNAQNAPFMDGDIVGGFNDDGYCAGLAQLSTNATFALTLNRNDAFTDQTTGFEDGEMLNYKVYRPSTGESFALDVVYNTAMTLDRFTANGLSEITDVKASALSVGNLNASQISIYPNPSSGKFNIMGVDGLAEIEVSNAYGKLMLRQTLDIRQGLDLSSYPNGIYLLKITTNNANESMHKLIIH